MILPQSWDFLALGGAENVLGWVCGDIDSLLEECSVNNSRKAVGLCALVHALASEQLFYANRIV